MHHSYIATCPSELQEIVAAEIKRNGGVDIYNGFKAIEFKAKLPDAYKMHLASRFSSRIFQVIKRSSGSSLAIISHQAAKVKWEEYISPNSTFMIEGATGDRGPKSPSSTQISKAVRLGLENYYEYKKLQKPTVDLKQPNVKIVAFIRNKRLTLSIDTSGKTFHKRGYKLDHHPAPLKETLAAAILEVAKYDGSETLYDPMCGSGTIAIEAAMIALNKAPLIHRKKGEFGLESLAGFDSKLWRSTQDSLRTSRRDFTEHSIIASDKNPSFVSSSRTHALRARVEKYIDFSSGDFFETDAPAASGLLITNLPYGERIEQDNHETMKAFYQKIGDTLKARYKGWRVALLVAEDSPYKFIGLKPSSKTQILNGSIRCKLLTFEIYAGSKKSSN